MGRGNFPAWARAWNRTWSWWPKPAQVSAGTSQMPPLPGVPPALRVRGGLRTAKTSDTCTGREVSPEEQKQGRTPEPDSKEPKTRERWS